MAAKYNPVTQRHSWEKLREHYYGCLFCALEKLNVEVVEASANLGALGHGKTAWVTKWRDRDGAVSDNRVARQPKCDGGLVLGVLD